MCLSLEDSSNSSSNWSENEEPALERALLERGRLDGCDLMGEEFCKSHLVYLIKAERVVHRHELAELQAKIKKSETQTVDHDYLDLCRRILADGSRREDRTGTGTISKFGVRLDIDLKKGFPLLTTKRVFWNGVVRELLWFISGSVNARELAAKGVHIWDGNSSRDYLDSRGLKDYPEGIVGPSYGWQWRSFGAQFFTFGNDPAFPEGITSSDIPVGSRRGGIDQLANVIHQIRVNPTDRRLIVTAWNPSDMTKMALPPCHILYQFYVDNGELSCQMYQRSVDVGLGLPFNIASYALLTHLVAHVTMLRVGRLIMCLGDTHIYSNHVEGLTEQMSRIPRDLATLRINGFAMDLDFISERNIELVGYNPHPVLTKPMPMAV